MLQVRFAGCIKGCLLPAFVQRNHLTALKHVKRFFCGLAIAAFVLLTITPPCEAANWFNRFGSSLTTSSGSAFETQKQGHFAGGGLSYRVPTDSTPLFNITPPRIQAGCGGIDAFWGGFSFLNPEFLIQKLKSILQHAPAYAFDLALNKLCAPCANIMKSLDAIANQLNALAMDDCKASQALVNAGANLLTNAFNAMATTGASEGSGPSYLTEMTTSVNEGLKTVQSGVTKFRETLNELINYKYCDGSTAQTNQEDCRKLFTASGSLWEKAVKISQDRGDDFPLDSGVVGVLKAMYGDVTFIPPDEAEKKGSDETGRIGIVEKISPCEGVIPTLLSIMTEVDESTVNYAMNKLPVISDAGKCTDRSFYDIAGSSDAEKLLFGKAAMKAMKDIKIAFATNLSLNTETITLINNSSIPVYSYINLMSLIRTGGNDLSNDELRLAKLLAVGNAMNVLDTMHYRAAEITAEAKVFFSQLQSDGGYNITQAIQALDSMNFSFESVRYLLTEKAMKVEKEHKEHMERLSQYYVVRDRYRHIVSANLVGK